MRVALVFGLLGLTGCGMMSDLRDATVETKQYVKESNEKIDATKKGQQLGLAYEILLDKDKSPSARAGAAEVIFAEADKTRIPIYIGALVPSVPLELQPATSRRVGDRQVELPNVTIVAENAKDADNALDVQPVDHDLYVALVSGVMLALNRIKDNSQHLALLSPEQVTQLKAFAPRMVHIATTIAGAMTLNNLREVLAGRAVRAFAADRLQHEETVTKREKVYGLLKDISHNLGFSRAQDEELRALAKIKLGLPN